jgi:hypothetical protein
MTEPSWLDPDAVIALHAESLAEFGGAPGLRDALLNWPARVAGVIAAGRGTSM